MSFFSPNHFSTRVLFTIILLSCWVCGGASTVHAEEKPTPKTVRITQDGFNPKTLEILQGESVTFVNDDTDNHWPASSIHPTHEIYPEFDPKQDIKPKDSWTFTFGKVGEWYYHDHLNPTKSGKITVKPQQTDSDTAASQTPKRSWYDNVKIFYRSLKLHFLMWYNSLFYKGEPGLASKNLTKALIKHDNTELIADLKSYGPEKIIQKLFEESGKGTLYNCHTYAHQVGRLSYKILNEDAITKNITLCHSGYIHGSIASFIKDRGTDNLAQKVSDVCEKAQTSFGKLTCYHGSGHGLMAYVNNDLPEAINKCKEFDTPFKASNCLVGVFMENIGSVTGDSLTDHATNWINQTDAQFPCNKIEQSSQILDTCYAIQPSWMYHLYAGDMKKVADECKQAVSAAQPACYFGYGQVAALDAKFVPAKIIDNCGKVEHEKNFLSRCLVGAQMVVLDYWGPNIKDQGVQLCEAMTADDRNRCEVILKKRTEDYNHAQL